MGSELVSGLELGLGLGLQSNTRLLCWQEKGAREAHTERSTQREAHREKHTQRVRQAHTVREKPGTGQWIVMPDPNPKPDPNPWQAHRACARGGMHN